MLSGMKRMRRMTMNKVAQDYLVIETTFFFDAHGCPDEGGSIKFVSDNPIYGKLNPNAYYNGWSIDETSEDDFKTEEELLAFLKEEERDGDNLWAEDSYNCEVVKYTVKKITIKEALELMDIIEAYDNIEIKEEERLK